MRMPTLYTEAPDSGCKHNNTVGILGRSGKYIRCRDCNADFRAVEPVNINITYEKPDTGICASHGFGWPCYSMQKPAVPCKRVEP